MFSDILAAVALATVSLAAWLLPKYLEKRVTEAARGVVDVQVGKTLATFEHALSRQLEEHKTALQRPLEELRQSLAIERERYSKDYSLFAERRNAVYAETYAHFEKTRGPFGGYFNLLGQSRDFSHSREPDLRRYVEKFESITAGERAELGALVDRGALDEARKLTGVLNERAVLRNAVTSFYEFRNACALNSLYYTPHVSDLLSQAVGVLSELAHLVDALVDGGGKVGRRDGIDAVRRVDALAVRLRTVMRDDMQAGFLESEEHPG